MPPEELHDSDLLSVASSTTPSTVQQSLENKNIPVQLDELKIVGDNTENYIVNAYFPEGDERNLAYTIVKEEPEIKPSLWNKFVDFVWPDYILKHLDYPSFKITFRSWCQLWVCTVLTIIPATSHWMGGAAYLIIVLGFITVSGGTSIAMNTLSSIAGFIGVIIAFLHHVITTKIINHIHHGITPETLTKNLIDEGLCHFDSGLEQCIQDQIFTGRYITTTGSAVTILSIITCTFIVGNMREHMHPLWALVYVSGQIAICIFACYGHFLPLFDPLEIGYVVIKPFALGFIAKIVSALLVYPTTSNWSFFNGYTKILKGLKSSLEKNAKFFKTMKPSASNFGNYKMFKKEILKLRGSMAPLEIVASTIWLEYSYGRFDVGDVGEFRSLLKNLFTSSSTYTYFYQLLEERTHFVRNEFALVRKRSNASSQFARKPAFDKTDLSYTDVAEYELRQRLKIMKSRIILQGEEDSRLTTIVIDEMATRISQYFAGLLDNADTGIEVIAEWLEAANDFRIFSWVPGQWSKHVSLQERLNAKVKVVKLELEIELAKFDNVETLKKIMIDTSKPEKEVLFLISQGVFFLQIVKHQCENILKVLDYCLELDERRPTPKFITYFSKTKYSEPKHLSNKIDVTNPGLENIVRKRNADTLPPINLFQYIGYLFTKLYKYLISNEFWFWIKVGGIITIGAIPYFVRPLANLYYRNRMIWLVIVIAVSISENTGSSVYVVFARLCYSFFGAVVGMVAWYISCGNGQGNYYGYGAVTAVLFMYFIYFRHFSVHQTLLPQILYSVTAVLVLGTSWVDAIYNKLANVDVGYKPAYLRFIGVAIGLCLGMLAVLLPKPISSKAIVRNVLAKTISETGNIHCDVANFALARLETPDYNIKGRQDAVLSNYSSLLMRMAGLSKLMSLKLEVPIAGYWPESKYKRLLGLVTDVIQLYLMLSSALQGLDGPEKWLPVVIKRVGFCFPDLQAEVFATIHMASDALRTKQALPKITEANISLKHMELLRQQWGLRRISLSERFYCDSATNNNNENTLKELDHYKLFSNDGQLNIMSLLVAHMIYNRLDEIMILVKGLVGEIYDLNERILVDEDDYFEFKQDLEFSDDKENSAF